MMMVELEVFKNASGPFGLPMAIKQREMKSPVQAVVKEIGKFFSMNRLAQSRLNDMVFFKYNRALQRRMKRNDAKDPILLEELDDSNEWLMGKMDGNSSSDEDDAFVHDDEDLTWSVSKCYGPLPSHLELVDEDDDVEEELGEGVGYEKDLDYEEHDSESE
ncbi:BnaC03g24150D [Brassica napus]|uniref:BnaC03g24150D protein n=2 Tax=Brassica TaxID=3705 RepID=A0A078I4Z2_BRANA|nr:BnaC03g24150D [Brassica napus]